MIGNQKIETVETQGSSVNELEYYKTATNLFLDALRTILVTNGGHKCNRIAGKALSIYHSMIRPSQKDRVDSRLENPGVSSTEAQVNPYADGAFVGISE